MDKIFIIFEREYLSRVKKKSFILSTLLTPLIFPIFIAIAVFLLGSDDEDKRIISLLDGKNLIEDTLNIGNNSTIGAGSVITEDVNSGDLAIGRERQVNKKNRSITKKKN